MITERIEKLIMSGRARWRNIPVGASGNNMIPVQDDGYSIIIGVTIYDFINGGNNSIPIHLTEIFKRLNLQVEIKSGNEKNHFVTRPQIAPFFSGKDYEGSPVSEAPEDLNLCGMPTGKSHFETYMVCRKNIVINTVVQPPSNLINDLNYSAVADGASDDDAPSGYADLAASQYTNINDFGYIELTREGNRSEPITTRNYLEKLKFPVNNNTKLRQNDDPLYLEDLYMSVAYPIINVQLIEINEPTSQAAN